MDRWEPVPVPQGDGRHDIGDDVRAAIVQRLIDDWSRDPDLTPEKVRQLAMWAAASVRALLHELGTLRDLANEGDLVPEAEALMLDGPAERSEGNSPQSEGNSPPWREGPAACTNCGESAKPHPAYADFVGPFCEGCWDRLREHFAEATERLRRGIMRAWLVCRSHV